MNVFAIKNQSDVLCMVGGQSDGWHDSFRMTYAVRLHFVSLTHHTRLFIDMDNIINT